MVAKIKTGILPRFYITYSMVTTSTYPMEKLGSRGYLGNSLGLTASLPQFVALVIV